MTMQYTAPPVTRSAGLLHGRSAVRQGPRQRTQPPQGATQQGLLVEDVTDGLFPQIANTSLLHLHLEFGQPELALGWQVVVVVLVKLHEFAEDHREMEEDHALHVDPVVL